MDREEDIEMNVSRNQFSINTIIQVFWNYFFNPTTFSKLYHSKD